MQRAAFEDLAVWKESPDRKPLVIRGARQVGKTWLMRQFGAECYKSVAYFNFDEDVNLASVFEANKDPYRIVELLSLVAGEKIYPRDTLIIFDEIQECSAALNACDADNLVQWHRHVDVFEIVDACAADVDRLNVGHVVALFGMGLR